MFFQHKWRYLVAFVAAFSAGTQAADIRLNGFASMVAGMTLNEAELPGGDKATFTADEPSNGVYDDDFSFRPDSIFGLQISADLGDGLSVTGQITGAGGEDFEANLAWAYVTYEFNQNWSVNLGRQRTPLFNFSDFLDVGYAYHWIRPPTEANISIDTSETVTFNYFGSTDNWDNQVTLYAGSAEADSPFVGPIGVQNTVGMVAQTSSSWLKLRASYASGEFFTDALEAFGQGEDNPVDVEFAGLAAQLNFGDTTLIAEYMQFEFADPLVAIGWTKYSGAYVSLAHRFGVITPHITFSTQNQDVENAVHLPDFTNPDFTQAAFIGDATQSANSITVGVRWDFHRAAAFKVEYQTRTDESDASVIAARGDVLEVDLVSAGIDVTF